MSLLCLWKNNVVGPHTRREYKEALYADHRADITNFSLAIEEYQIATARELSPAYRSIFNIK